MERRGSESGEVYNPTTMNTGGSTRRQYIAAVAANLVCLVAGTALGWSSPILPKMSKEDYYLYATDDEASWVGSLIALGAAIGPFPAGIMADRLGRKKTMLALAPPFILGWIIITAAQSIGLIYFGRIVLGFAVGAVFTVCPMYVGEIAEPSVRGALGSFVQVFVTIGLLYEYCIGPYVSYVALGIASGIIPFIFFGAFYFVPDSPYHLVAQGRTDEARTALQWLRQAPVENIVKELEDIELSVAEVQRTAGTLKDLVKSRGNVKALYLSLGLVSFQQLSGINAVLFYSETIFLKTGSSLSASTSTIIVGIVMFLSSCSTPLLVDRLGRKLLLYMSSLGMAIALAVLGFYFYKESSGGPEAVASITWLPVLSLVFYIIVYSFGFGPLAWAVMGELFPANVKSKAVTATASFCWLLGFVTTKFFANIVNALGIHTAFFIFCVCCILAFVFVLMLLPETKGKSLQEIQDILNGKTAPPQQREDDDL